MYIIYLQVLTPYLSLWWLRICMQNKEYKRSKSKRMQRNAGNFWPEQGCLQDSTVEHFPFTILHLTLCWKDTYNSADVWCRGRSSLLSLPPPPTACAFTSTVISVPCSLCIRTNVWTPVGVNEICSIPRSAKYVSIKPADREIIFCYFKPSLSIVVGLIEIFAENYYKESYN